MAPTVINIQKPDSFISISIAEPSPGHVPAWYMTWCNLIMKDNQGQIYLPSQSVLPMQQTRGPACTRTPHLLSNASDNWDAPKAES